MKYIFINKKKGSDRDKYIEREINKLRRHRHREINIKMRDREREWGERRQKGR